jgi:class 3 adenylate cyclase
MPHTRLLSFEELISRFFELPEAEAELRRRYETEIAVLVVDFSSMVERSNHQGVLYALALARAAERAMAPSIEAAGGEIIKRVADTFFVVFPTPQQALEGALAGLRAALDWNRPRQGALGGADRDDPIWPCLGLGFGRAVFIPGVDVFGEEVNRAFVLGEDIARHRELLCTEAFLAAIEPLPQGVGAYRGPQDREKEAGFPFVVLSDYRDP